MYDLIAYGAMIADKVRTSAYAQALERRITPNSIVLDLGTGTGILALLACRAGAARVYAVEAASVIDLARQAAGASSERIMFIQGMSTAIDLPERVDGIVTDIHGVLPLYEQSVVSLIDARDRFLKPGGWIIPARETMWGAIVCSPAAYKSIEVWNTEYGFDFSSARRAAASTWGQRRLKAADLIVEPQCWATLDYAEVLEPRIHGELSWTVGEEAVGHGLAVWFDAEMAPGIAVSNSPAAEERVYGQGFFPWPDPVRLARGDDVRVHLRADLVGEHYVWTWNTEVVEPASRRVKMPRVKMSCRQSSLLAEPVGADQLRRRADTFVPDLNADARVDLHILMLMGRHLSLGEIATAILTTFPDTFKDWNEALARVGVLSDRYSR
jgi:protein arginine N-methyltransferase 1